MPSMASKASKQISEQVEKVMTDLKIPTPLEFLQALYMNVEVPLHMRMRAAVEAAQYVHPQLKAHAILTDGSFAQRLDKAIARSRGEPKVIEARPISEGPAKVPTDLRPPLPHVADRRYRRW
jgi:hypothetical protein